MTIPKKPCCPYYKASLYVVRLADIKVTLKGQSAHKAQWQKLPNQISFQHMYMSQYPIENIKQELVSHSPIVPQISISKVVNTTLYDQEAKILVACVKSHGKINKIFLVSDAQSCGITTQMVSTTRNLRGLSMASSKIMVLQKECCILNVDVAKRNLPTIVQQINIFATKWQMILPCYVQHFMSPSYTSGNVAYMQYHQPSSIFNQLINDFIW